MAQGKKWNKKEILEVLKPFLKLGYSINKACDIVGIPESTVHTWIGKDAELRVQFTAWQNEISTLARQEWLVAIKEGKPSKFGPDRYTPSKEWLERKDRDEFSTRTDFTSGDDKIQRIDIQTLLEKAYGTNIRNEDMSNDSKES